MVVTPSPGGSVRSRHTWVGGAACACGCGEEGGGRDCAQGAEVGPLALGSTGAIH